MTLHALRGDLGDRGFQRLIRAWVRTQSGGHVTKPELVALAERVAGGHLDDFFEVWLYMIALTHAWRMSSGTTPGYGPTAGHQHGTDAWAAGPVSTAP